MLYFFLSYAREDDPEYIRRFFRDLTAQVRNLSGAGIDDPVGFLDDQSLQTGQRWSAELTEALSTCRCFVAMTSPRYFRREYCGREWALFSDRLDAYQRRWRRSAPALLPVTWIPTGQPHPVAADIQSTNSLAATKSCEEYGLRQMLDLKRFRDDYRTFVFKLARRIVTVAAEHEIPRPTLSAPLADVANAFADPRPVAREAPAAAQAVRLSDRSFVHFVVVAGSRDEMLTIRTKVDFYGALRPDWAPYRPSVEGPLAELATHVANERLFDSDVCDIADLADRLASARAGNALVVLLVDAWSPLLDEHRRALSEYDGQDDITGAVMIPFSVDDAETLADTTVLQVRLASVLPRILERRDRVMLRQNVPTAEQFGNDLQEILEVAQNRIFKKGAINPNVSERPSGTRPILEGPTSTTEGEPS